MSNKIALKLNSVDLLKYALYKEYALPADLSILNLTQERILMTIKNSINVSMVSISRSIGLEKGPFSQSVDKLEELNLVKRVRSINDKRQVYLELTDRGTEITNLVEDSMEQHFLQRVSVLSNLELDDLYTALNTLNKIANKLILK